MTVDPRYARLPADAEIPLTLAHNLVGRTRATLYRWAATGQLDLTDTPDGQLVRVGSVREFESTVRRGARPKRHANSARGEL